MVSFVHLKCHSDMTSLQGLFSSKDLVSLCIENKMPAVGVTDLLSLSGAMEFSLELSKGGVQPIIGCELPVSHGAHDGKITCLVQNQLGYTNLLRLLRLSASPLDLKVLLKKSNGEGNANMCYGIIALDSVSNGITSGAIKSGCEGKEEALILQKLFKDRFYIEINRYAKSKDHTDFREENKNMEQAMLMIAKDLNIPIVATNDCYFKDSLSYNAHDVFWCIKDNEKISDTSRNRISQEQYFKSQEEMSSLFSDLPEAVENTVAIAKRCGFALEESEPILPKFDVGSDSNEHDHLYKKSYEGLMKRLDDSNVGKEYRDDYIKRLEKEFQVIKGMDFSGYFLIVSDFISYAKREGIPVGPGRGSGSASVISWGLGITELDPLRFRLIFERFLNPDRVSLPDFDIDFCPEKRDRVIEYVRSKYGEDKVAHIITFGRLNARAVIRDVGRVMGKPFGLVERLAKMIPFQPAKPVTLKEALSNLSVMNDLIKRENLEEMFDICLRLEGLPRHESTHAAGIVIGNKSLYESTPIAPMTSLGCDEKDQKDIIPIIQFAMKDVERSGLVKFDFLGLTALTVMHDCVSYLNSKGTKVDLNSLSFDDKKTYKLLQTGFTTGVFQLESVGMQRVLRQLVPDNIEDIMAVIALFRPGPMENIPKYVASKHNRQKEDTTTKTDENATATNANTNGAPGVPGPATAAHTGSVFSIIDNLLKETYGVIVYQEQVMEIAQVFSGYTAGQADLLRRAMGKKKPEEMQAQKDFFIEGAMKKHSAQKEEAQQVFELVERFASYGFNKAHAAGYAMISYQMGWLKAHHKSAFFMASMNHEMKNLEKLALFRQDMERFEVKLLPPHINKSGFKFEIEEQLGESHNSESIRFGLGAVKGLSDHLCQLIVESRQKDGEYKDLFDFLERIIKAGGEKKIINKRSLDILAASGSLDGLGLERWQICSNLDKGHDSNDSRVQDPSSLDTMSQFLIDIVQDNSSEQMGLFEIGGSGAGGASQKYYELIENRLQKDAWESAFIANQEYQTLGMYFSQHPTGDVFKERDDLCYYKDFDIEKSKNALFCCAINKMEHKKWGDKHMLFLTVSDPSGIFYLQLDKPEMINQVMERMKNSDALVPIAIFSIRAYLSDNRERLNVDNIDWTLKAKPKKIQTTPKPYMKDNNNIENTKVNEHRRDAGDDSTVGSDLVSVKDDLLELNINNLEDFQNIQEILDKLDIGSTYVKLRLGLDIEMPRSYNIDEKTIKKLFRDFTNGK